MITNAETLTRAERRKLETRQEILEAAFDCFAEHGYHGTGIADIAERLGMGHGTFYRYFENKRDIVEHVVADVMAHVLTTLQEENAPDAVSSLEEYRAQTDRIAEALIDILLRDPRVPRLLLLEAPGVDAAMAERVLDFIDGAAMLTAEYLRHGVEFGYLRDDLDVDVTARAINGLILSGALTGVRNDDRDAARAYAHAAVRVMYDGISASQT